MLLYRIAKKQYSGDFSGKGAAMFGGRWNNAGVYVLYTSTSPALAMLECLVHISQLQLAVDLELVTLEIPDSSSFTKITTSNLPQNWQMSPAPQSLASIGDNFVKNGQVLGLVVPSVVMPEMENVILNVAHADMHLVKVVNSRPLILDERLLK